MTNTPLTLADITQDMTVTLNGKQYPVRPIDGFSQQLVQQMTENNSVTVMYKVAARCLRPGLSWDEVFGTEEIQGLTPQQVAAVVAVASGHVEKVEALVSPNSEPAGEREPSPTH